MGLFFTLFYILTAYLTPTILLGSLAEYHVEIIAAIAALIATLFTGRKAGLLTMPQTYAALGLLAASFLSVATSGWIGGGQHAMLEFLPSLFAYFFVVMNCKTRVHLQMVILTLLFVCLFVIGRGYYDIRMHNIESPFLMYAELDSGADFFRLRGLGFINDPNDFAQVLVSLTPCLFFLWRPKRPFLNLLRVIVPSVILVFGMFLTHSRGSMIALLACILLAARRKVGTVPSVVLAAVLFSVSMAAGWSGTGGRNVSVEAGEDRMEAWSVGLQLIKSHPIFGVGYRNFGDFYEITAHNTVVVCCAELGVVGLFFWVMFIYMAFWESSAVGNSGSTNEVIVEEYVGPAHLGRVAKGKKSSTALTGGSARAKALHLREAPPDTDFAKRAVEFRASVGTAILEPAEAGYIPLGQNLYAVDAKKLEDDNIRRLARVMVISLTGFAVSGWFLSRAYQMLLFILGGMAEVIYQIALERGIAPPRMPVGKLVRATFLAVLGLIALVYVMLRLDHLMPK